jgi:hypothetical protein
MSSIQVTLPIASNVAKGLAAAKLTQMVMAQAKPLPAVLPADKNSAFNFFGVPVYSVLRIRYNGIEYVLNDCVIVVSQEKQIATTYLQGRNGSIKEYIADGDYSIDINATIGNDYLLDANGVYDTAAGDYPVQEMQMFLEILKAPVALEVSSDFLELFGIKSMVIKNYTIPQQTHSNRQAISMQCLSDEPYEIKLLQDA